MNSLNNKIQYILYITKDKYSNSINPPIQYSIEEYDHKSKLFRDMKIFINKYEVKLYLALRGIKFDIFEIYYYLTARMINFYDE